MSAFGATLRCVERSIFIGPGHRDEAYTHIVDGPRDRCRMCAESAQRRAGSRPGTDWRE